MRKNILVTGANGNLGNKVVENLHQKGCEVHAFVGSSHFSEELKNASSTIGEVDLLNATATADYLDILTSQHPSIDGAVLLVGSFANGNIEETDEKELDRQMALNFKTVWHVVQPLLAHFKKHLGGQFVFIGARPVLNPNEGINSVAYTLSKSLLFCLADIINAAGKDANVSATVIVPSTIDTSSNRASSPGADFSTWVTPEDLAETISFALSSTGMNLRNPIFKVYNRA